jgi:outer membrane lipopolysaccharide assembly protein LptE/RlpB
MRQQMRLFHLFQNLKSLLLSLLVLNLTACGYRAAPSDEKTTISIPYVEGDSQGQFTTEIIRQLNHSDLYDLVRKDGDLVLKVTLVNDHNVAVGFKYDRTEKKGKIEQSLMPAENRRTLTAKVTLLCAATEEVVMGPVNITTWADYDFIDVNSLKELAFRNSHGKREKTVKFSLGQLDSVEGGQDAVLTPLYRQLAQKIISAMVQNSILTSDD